jgi:hypothetical protein
MTNREATKMLHYIVMWMWDQTRGHYSKLEKAKNMRQNQLVLVKILAINQVTIKRYGNHDNFL